MLTIRKPERQQRRRSGVFIVNFERISHLVPSVSTVNFEQIFAPWNLVKSQAPIQTF